MVYDLVVRGGSVVDGTGAPAATGDVAVADGRIVAVGQVDGEGRREVDAAGLVVAPGFVDAHTHMDAQVFYDDLGMPSCWHGVTTTVMGNCGFGLAPVRPEHRQLVSSIIERSEDIPAAVLERGVPWTWSTFSEYLDVLGGLTHGVNAAQAVGHSALRIWAMGDRAFEAPASAEEIEVMRRELAAALRAGAVGFSTSRSAAHSTTDDRPVASRLADWGEVEALVAVMGEVGRGCFEESGGEPGVSYEGFIERISSLSLTTGVPVLVPAPSLAQMRAVEAAAARGAEIWGMTHSRGFSVLQSFETRLSFDHLGGAWADLRSRPLEEQRRMLRQPEIVDRLVDEAGRGEYPPVNPGGPFEPDYDQIYVMESAYLPNPSVADEARRRGVEPARAMIDIALERDLKVFFMQVFPGIPFAGHVPAAAELDCIEALRHPRAAMTFSDAGAHSTFIADASIPSHLLAYWVRERQALTLEEAVRAVTSHPARAWGLSDRGVLAEGYAADITVFDPATVGPLVPQVVRDIPAGGIRLEQRADGFVATIVNGEVLTSDGADTGARPGRLLGRPEEARS